MARGPLVDMDKAQIIKALRDTAQAASNTAASTVSGPIDLLAAALRYGGVPIPENAFGGSKWMGEQGLTKEVEQGIPRAVGETLGMVGPALATQFAPQIAGVINKGASNLAAPARLNKETGAIVWHGSPHKFDKFDSSKIGTGEGAQAYGHGLYLAENPSVAREYQEKLSSVGGAKNLASQYGDIDKGIAEAQRRIASYKELIANGGGGAMERAQRMLNLSEKNLQDLSAMKAGLPENTGALYKVDLPDEQIAKMLDWDKPMSQQSATVKKAWQESKKLLPSNALDDLGGDLSLMYGKDVTPLDFLNTWESLGQKAGGEAALKQLGVPGVRYFDGGSRAAGSGTSNFVVFPGNENMLSILERNGKPLGLMGVR